ncbi:hypothetical protein SDC9_122602 [bioreactor metagenome]|uniref:Uncharacterized protein n=1 Tax=bioreactor metagenome TaxID=1076179 RepID=A0A645CFD0_9ZZZZ
MTFILAVSDITAVLPTVLSRCFRLKTEAVEIKTMTALLREKYPEKSADELEKIALLSGGSVGSALKLAEDEEFAALRKRAEDFTEKCTRGAGLAELFDTFGDNSDKNGVLTLMAMLKLSFRDVIVSRFSGMTGFTPMFWSDTERLYSLCGIPDEKYLLKLFSKLEELLTPSNKNVNVSIAVTAFILCAAGFDSDIASREYH